MAKFIHRVILRLTNQQSAKLNQMAEDSNQTVSEVIRRLIEEA